MELLHKYLSNQIPLPDFLKEADGKPFISEKTAIDFITSGLEKAINTYNHIETNYIQYSYKDHEQYIHKQNPFQSPSTKRGFNQRQYQILLCR